MATPAANPPSPSPAPKLVSSSVQGGFDIRFSWTLDFNILEPPKELVELPPSTSPLAGSWQTELRASKEPGRRLEVLVSHDDLAFERILSSATVELSLHWICDTEHDRIAFIDWEDEPVPDRRAGGTIYTSYRLDVPDTRISVAAARSKGIYDPALHRCYRFDFTIRQTDSSPSRDAAGLVERLPNLSLDPHPNVRLFFPRFGKDGAELWTTRDLLENSTYRAVLVFLQTRFIRFTPLSSACKPNNPTAHSTREEQVAGLFDNSPAVPVSPKSAYRLAHLLELEDLQQYCLDALRKGLFVDGAAYELFSDVSACYDAWRAAVLEYVVENWDEVSKTPSWLGMVTKIKAGEMPSMAGIAFELMEAREKRKG